MSPRKKSPTPFPPPRAAAGAPRRGLTVLGGAALATLAWAGIILLGLPEIAGGDGISGLLWAAVAGAIIGLTPLRKLLWVFAALVLTLLLVVGFTPLIVRPVLNWPRRDVVALPPPDAVVVLSSWVSSDSLLDPEAVDRLLAGLTRAKEWRRPLVISTMVARYGPIGVPSTTDQRRIIALAGDSITVFAVDSVQNTHDEAVAVATLAGRQGWRSVALVTSPLHSRRACAAFERAGLLVACLPAQSRDIDLTTLGAPTDRLRGFGWWLYERLGWIEYRWRGWI
jgi:uncharacterized SAM-binding protein YcdF (DUF218 family)